MISTPAHIEGNSEMTISLWAHTGICRMAGGAEALSNWVSRSLSKKPHFKACLWSPGWKRVETFFRHILLPCTALGAWWCHRKVTVPKMIARRKWFSSFVTISESRPHCDRCRNIMAVEIYILPPFSHPFCQLRHCLTMLTPNSAWWDVVVFTTVEWYIYDKSLTILTPQVWSIMWFHILVRNHLPYVSKLLLYYSLISDSHEKAQYKRKHRMMIWWFDNLIKVTWWWWFDDYEDDDDDDDNH